MSDLVMIGVIAIVFAIFVYRSSENQTAEEHKEYKRTHKNDDVDQEQNKNRPFNRHNKKYTLKNKYAAVTIAHEIDACQQVKELGNVRFLVRNAPLLPVRGCTKSKACECHYMHHLDRRKVDRRSDAKPVVRTESNHRSTIRRGIDRSQLTG